MKEIEAIIGSKQIYLSDEDTQKHKVVVKVSEKEESIYLFFDCIDESTQEMVHHQIKIKAGKVYVTRKGAIQNHLIFDKETPYVTSYQTPYGILDMTLITQAITCKILQDDINLEIKYEIIMQGEKISDNIYFIKSKF